MKEPVCWGAEAPLCPAFFPFSFEMRLVTSSPATVIWNPADYAANSAAQLAWARELITKLKLRGDERVLDVGCGDGKVTAEIAQALPRGEITGVDSSAEMI